MYVRTWVGVFDILNIVPSTAVNQIASFHLTCSCLWEVCATVNFGTNAICVMGLKILGCIIYIYHLACPWFGCESFNKDVVLRMRNVLQFDLCHCDLYCLEPTMRQASFCIRSWMQCHSASLEGIELVAQRSNDLVSPKRKLAKIPPCPGEEALNCMVGAIISPWGKKTRQRTLSIL